MCICVPIWLCDVGDLGHQFQEAVPYFWSQWWEYIALRANNGSTAPCDRWACECAEGLINGSVLVTFHKCYLTEIKRWCHFISNTHLCRYLIWNDSITKNAYKPSKPWLSFWLEWVTDSHQLDWCAMKSKCINNSKPCWFIHGDVHRYSAQQRQVDWSCVAQHKLTCSCARFTSNVF